ncbi:energy-coupling factor ABC transporter ATP-binding protein [Brunnivagina elsteri]|uniref:ABC transporter ATP-binding protein n=1 Tax=Brunnivagina elsteri CCALA 953 TaxID=987040 RepID=A0A2A2TIN5_9CYAN|nr:ABC transporter ATP-binding protein [Calothrix elsteri]PAX53878.1 cobalt ABC transporter ATP-binding protein [Calothrix elsteri CCALA 953]
MEEYLLEFEEVYYTYIGTKASALNGLNLKIPKHKKSALIGQNGCGKTTFFLLANALYKPQQGNILWQGKAIKYDSRSLQRLRQQVGLVFQDPEQQLVAATVEEDISYGLCNLGIPNTEIAQRIEAILLEFGLTELAQKPVHHLSLGQKKRVSIADVMVLEPELILLDEPTAYLDRLHTRNLINTLNKIHNSGTTILMATHDFDLVYRWADWVFVMDNGKLIIEGTPKDIFNQQKLLADLQLDAPLIHEIFSVEVSQEEQLFLERLRQRILNLFDYR